MKNGTLGVVEASAPERLAVQLDAGRQVAFDLKDYAHVDHGYAATFQKAQGVTVDLAHVLATPGMDRHGAYVALSRHRDAVDLHYGRDDFADGQALARSLSRERTKDMASDYARDFAEQRGINMPDRAEPTLGRDAAVQRHARAVVAIFQMQEESRDYLPDQIRTLTTARAELDKTDPHASRDVERAYKADPALAHEATGGRTARALRAMQLEAELRRNAPARVDRFVERWTKLDEQRLDAYRSGDVAAMRRARDAMGAMAKSLERDPQLESILAAKTQALGIDAESGRRLSRQLAIGIGFDTGRGRGLGL